MERPSTFVLKYQNRNMMTLTGEIPTSITPEFDDTTGIPTVTIKIGTSELKFTGPAAWDFLYRATEARDEMFDKIDRYEEAP